MCAIRLELIVGATPKTLALVRELLQVRLSLAEWEAGHRERNQNRTELTGTHWHLPPSFPASNFDAAEGIRALI